MQQIVNSGETLGPGEYGSCMEDTVHAARLGILDLRGKAERSATSGNSVLINQDSSEASVFLRFVLVSTVDGESTPPFLAHDRSGSRSWLEIPINSGCPRGTLEPAMPRWKYRLQLHGRTLNYNVEERVQIA